MKRILLALICSGVCLTAVAQSGSPRDSCAAYRLGIEELQQLPGMTVRLAFHFVALPDGRNFAPEAELEKLRAATFLYYVLGEMNTRMRVAVLDYPPSRDTRLRFALVNGPQEPLASCFFYGNRDKVVPLDGAMNVVFTDYRGRGKAPDGAITGTGSNRITVYNRLQTYLAGSQDTWTVARLINHEFGHTQGLDHSFKCDNPCAGIDLEPREECFGVCTTNNAGSTAGTNCYGGSERALMMGYGTQLSLTVCETEQLLNYLLNHPRPYINFDRCTPRPATPPQVFRGAGTQVLGGGRKLYFQDLIVGAGTTLAVRCPVEMAPGTSVLVEAGGQLVIDGGSLTNACPTRGWGGIRVAAGPGGGVPPVVLRNGGRVEERVRAVGVPFPY